MDRSCRHVSRLLRRTTRELNLGAPRFQWAFHADAPGHRCSSGEALAQPHGQLGRRRGERRGPSRCRNRAAASTVMPSLVAVEVEAAVEMAGVLKPGVVKRWARHLRADVPDPWRTLTEPATRPR